MKILLTGSTGFLGQAIKLVYSEKEIITLGRNKCDVTADLSIAILDLPRADGVIHAAGKAHSIPKTQKEKDDYFLVNVKGTQNLLDALEKNLPKSFLFISSVAVYGKTTGNLINEEEELSALDPYGKSKIEAEKLIEKWCFKNKVRLCILRLPLLVGLNPPGNLKAMIKGISSGFYFNIAGGGSRKSMVMAQDIANILPKAMSVGGTYNLTDGYHPSIKEISDLISHQLGKSQPFNIPLWIANLLAISGDIFGGISLFNSNKLTKLTTDLTFDDSKARKFLDWSPELVMENFHINL